MSNSKRTETGFTLVEVLLISIFISLVVFIGLYVVNNRKTDTNPSASTQSVAPTSPSSSKTLAQATDKTTQIYSEYKKKVLDGQILQDKSQWASENGSAAQDLQFINANSESFTHEFVKAANTTKATNSVPAGNAFLICFNGIAMFNSDIKTTGDTLKGQSAIVNVNYTIGHEKTKISFPVTLKVVNGAWVIDEVNLSDQYCPAQ